MLSHEGYVTTSDGVRLFYRTLPLRGPVGEDRPEYW
jgi:hypothetical protein